MSRRVLTWLAPPRLFGITHSNGGHGTGKGSLLSPPPLNLIALNSPTSVRCKANLLSGTEGNRCLVRGIELGSGTRQDSAMNPKGWGECVHLSAGPCRLRGFSLGRNVCISPREVSSPLVPPLVAATWTPLRSQVKMFPALSPLMV